MPTSGRLGIPFTYNEIIIEPEEIQRYQTNELFSELYVNWSGHFEFVDNNHAINRTLEYHLLLYITDGQGYLQVDGEDYIIRPGSMLFIARNVEHTYGNQRGAWWSGYWAHFSGTSSDRLVAHYINARYALMEVGLNDTLVSVFSDMHRQMRIGTQVHNILHAANALRYILSLTAQLRRAEQENSENEDALERILDLMYRNLTRPITLAEIAGHVHLSKSQIIRLFRQRTGYTPVQYHNLARMKEACNKMLYGEHNIGEIARSLGFENQYYFSTMFRRMFGYSPTQFIRGMHRQ